MNLGVLAQLTSRMVRTPVTAERVLSVSADAAVVRCRSERGPMVVKVQTGGKELASSERMALRLLSRAGCLATPVTPIVGVSVVVMEDLGDVPTVRDRLFDFDAAAARVALEGLAEALGTVHRYGHGLHPVFARGRAGPPRAEVEASQLQEALRVLPRVLSPIDVSVPEGVEALVAEAVQRLAAPGDAMALTHGDPHGGNALLSHRGVVLVDFEKAGRRHVLSDVVQWVVGPPLPVEVREAMLASWQRAVAPMWPAYGDVEALQEALQPLVVHRGLLTLAGMLTTLLEGDVELMSGFGGRQVLLSVLSGLRWREDALGVLAQRCLDALDTRWAVPLPRYPAFEETA